MLFGSQNIDAAMVLYQACMCVLPTYTQSRIATPSWLQSAGANIPADAAIAERPGHAYGISISRGHFIVKPVLYLL